MQTIYYVEYRNNQEEAGLISRDQEIYKVLIYQQKAFLKRAMKCKLAWGKSKNHPKEDWVSCKNKAGRKDKLVIANKTGL